MSVVAEKWRVAKISDFATTTSGGTPSRKNPEYYSGSIPWIKSGDLNNGIVREAEEFITEEALKNSSAKLFPSGTLLIALYGATIGKLGILSIEAATNQAVCGIFDAEGIEQKFLFFYLLHKKKDLIEQGKGGAQPNISQKIVRDIEVPLPPLPEQRRIVSKIEELFSKLDAGVAALKHAKAQLKRYRQSVLAAAVTGELTKEWRANNPNTEPANKLLDRILKQRREQWAGRGKYKEPASLDENPLGSIPRTWAWASIAQIGFVQLGRQRSPKNRSKDYPTKYIRAANITEGGLNLTDVLEMEFTPDEQSRFRLKAGDLVLSEASGSPDQVGKPAIWKDQLENYCFQNTVIRLRALGFDNEFLLILLKHFHRNKLFANLAGGVGINHLSAAKFSMMSAAVPPLAEQKQIVAEVEARTSTIDHIETELDQQLIRSTKLRATILKTAFENGFNNSK